MHGGDTVNSSQGFRKQGSLLADMGFGKSKGEKYLVSYAPSSQKVRVESKF